MSSATLKKQTDEYFLQVDTSADDRELALPTIGTEGHASPVHALQARLEGAVLASFSAKEAIKAPSFSRLRAVAIIVGASFGGWGLLMAGAALSL